MNCFFYSRLQAVVARRLRDPPFPSGSHVGLYSYSVICNGKYFTSVLNNILTIAV